MPPRGRKNPALLAQVRKDVSTAVTYVCGHKKLKFGLYELVEGVEVPGAAQWPRIEAWVNARAVRPARPDEEFVPFEVYKAKIDAERQAAAEVAQALSDELAMQAAAALEKDSAEVLVGKE